MATPEAEELLDELRTEIAERLDDSNDAKQIFDSAMAEFPASEGTSLEQVEVGEVRGLRVVAPGASEVPGILYMHGGGHAVGSAVSNQDLIARLSHSSGVTVVGIDCPLLPENPFPAALDATLAAYRELSSAGERQLVLAGSSAGGGLAVAAALSLREASQPQPAGIVCFSPWVDMTVSAPSLAAASDDDWLGREPLVIAAETYLDGREPTDWLASPLHADLAGLPPMLIQVGGSEILLDDSSRLADAARRAGTKAELDVWPGMFHNFQLFGSRLSEGAAALERAGRWARGRLDECRA
ncbi:MAG: alpha/beta hydrolase fold domain-containing protein [Solirubrobacterales bacterium]